MKDHRNLPMNKYIAILLLLFSGAAFADQTAITNFNASKTIFWRDLYPTGGHTLYCDQAFAGHSGLDVEHVYPASWMGAHLGCGNRTQCRKHSTHGTRFNRMEADLHNLFPAMAGLNRTRSNNTFGLIAGEERFLLQCDFESDSASDVTEPRPGARGDIARAFFYMHQEYDLPIDADLLPLLQQWNNDDPPSTYEVWRNDAINRLQGTRKAFIDDSALGNNLF
jgi:deoxyribonuclease-1